MQMFIENRIKQEIEYNEQIIEKNCFKKDICLNTVSNLMSRSKMVFHENRG